MHTEMNVVLSEFLSEFDRELNNLRGWNYYSNDPAHSSWRAMHDRCYRPTDKSWKWYGGKGIQVCVRWHKSNSDGFKNFVSDLGPRLPGLTIDRLNSDLSYMPSNCRWSTRFEQMRHHRRN